MKKISPLSKAHIAVDVVLIAVILCFLFNALHKAPKSDDANYYAQAATVTTINEMRGFTGFTDDNYRELYVSDTATWNLGDVVLLVVNSNGTEYLYDDEIVSVSLLMYAAKAAE